MFNLIKTTAVATALTLGGTAAFADNAFGQQMDLMDGSSINIELVNSETDGMVVIYDYHGAEFGDVLGMIDVNAGANRNVIIPLDLPATSDVAAVLYNGEATNPSDAAAWIEVNVES